MRFTRLIATAPSICLPAGRKFTLVCVREAGGCPYVWLRLFPGEDGVSSPYFATLEGAVAYAEGMGWQVKDQSLASRLKGKASPTFTERNVH